jgi:hypothetical protein
LPTTVCRSCGGPGSPLRWACPTCVHATAERLDEIREHAVAICAAGMLDGPGRAGRLDVPSSGGSLLPPTDEPLRAADPALAVLSILDVLHRIACHVRHHRGEPAEFRCTITSEVRYLRANVEWCAHQLWGHELVGAVDRLRCLTRARAGTLVR